MLLKDLLEEFILELQIQNYSPRTIKSYRNNNLLMFTFIEKKFDLKNIEKIKTVHIKAYIKFLQVKGNKVIYINGVIKSFRAFFKYAVKEDAIETNPMINISWLREKKTLINAFTNEEVERMMKVYTGSDYLIIRNKLIMAFLLDTGVRCLELCSIKNSDVRENNLLIKNGKGNKQRMVAISPYVKKLILRYVRCRDNRFKDRIIDDSTPFFLSYRFKALTVEGIERVVKICGKKANIRKDLRCSPHTCRHYFAQAQLRNGLDVYSLSRLLGHENISITKRYLQSINDGDIVEMSVRTSPLMNLRK
ncbi:integrase/recombinase XerD [Clostridium saccharoperbutylacetonicum]|uniref:Tyrosine recombinase XerC n=1 Tax=Clostridium saccharoperbutylacetonicum N1-4(HMT) TaxID=931276 RepID=M1LY90_9CLOT|nr:tyrosine-type recombinase/integrase [Clostridium saccharoperbutylacetonicum]AGF58220.1 tyrosine recombinase XerC [Clostridium saccharoperbutylacetonicum N1-4(HMT)]NRT61003.1 integrase/recombinase XerD [Clostridium saccharoperbutylacetonicum]NSB24318.1 integrase/recombinase XerD [Clostridium saccharoperbutylacetonicum]NSB43694.1 integrase/recombinase XerD [Clostridium saccharoperbutylacetonicum]